MRIDQGDIWLTDYGQTLGREQAGTRPAVIMSGSALNGVPLGLVVTAPVTTTARDWPFHVSVDTLETGLNKPSWVMLEQVRSVSVRRLHRRLGSVDDAAFDQLKAVLRHLLRK
ncbi:type II toxin-antitoxin system PemK/MazF family toxin [Planotetraspora phitsanulokensis]|uniref:mRNA interferase n=1 Tax=Planotetraspora phitsanulokensis TaxID=575192 RepID=A0A8J3U532_9ACTN|nr:type II toxin-antitoxin system PemK/MazF family toxin [Planotetraspora phitsanulokensis]GII38351.1 mRNA interferase [Planotetraspora phitsanulokensis]